MANLIPRFDGPIIAPAQVFTTLQKNATRLARDANHLKNTQLIGDAVALYRQCRIVGHPVTGMVEWKGNALLQNYADDIHPDTGYDLDAAIDVCVDAYQNYVTWFQANVTDQSKTKTDVNGDIVPNTPTLTGIGPFVNAIIATVE